MKKRISLILTLILAVAMVTTMLTAMSFSASADAPATATATDVVVRVWASDTDDRSTATEAVAGGITLANLQLAGGLPDRNAWNNTGATGKNITYDLAMQGKYVWVEFESFTIPVSDGALAGNHGIAFAAGVGKKTYVVGNNTVINATIGSGDRAVATESVGTNGKNAAGGEIIFQNITINSDGQGIQHYFGDISFEGSTVYTRGNNGISLRNGGATIKVDANSVIDGSNGVAVYMAEKVIITGEGTVTGENSGLYIDKNDAVIDVYANITGDTQAVKGNNKGTLNVYDGARIAFADNANNNSGYLAALHQVKNLNIYGGMITDGKKVSGSFRYALNMGTGSTVTMTGGQILGANNEFDTIILWGTAFNISGGEIKQEGSQNAIRTRNGGGAHSAITISGTGKITSGGAGIVTEIVSTITVKGGTISATKDAIKATSKDDIVNIIANANIEGNITTGENTTFKENIVAFDGTNYLDNAGVLDKIASKGADIVLDLLADITITKQLNIYENLTINGNGHTITIGEVGNTFVQNPDVKNKSITINNATITGNKNGGCVFQMKSSGASLNLTNVTMKDLKAQYYIINLMATDGSAQTVNLTNVTATEGIGANAFFSTGNANQHYMHAVINIKNSSIAHSKRGFQVNAGSTAAITIENSTITSAIEFAIVAPSNLKGTAATDSTIAISGDLTMGSGTSIVGVVTVNSGKLTINGASITSPKSGVVIIKKGAELEMTDGTIECTTGSNSINLAGKATISGGEVKNAAGLGVIRLDEGGEIYISGGTFTSKASTADKYIIQSNAVYTTLSKVIITGGTFNGGLKLSGNTQISISNAKFYGPIDIDTTNTGEIKIVNTISEATANINHFVLKGTKFVFDNTKITCCDGQWGCGIKLNGGELVLKNGTVINGAARGAAKTPSNGALEINAGKATVEAGVTISSTTGCAICVASGAELALAGDVTSTSGCAICVSGGTLVANDCDITGASDAAAVLLDKNAVVTLNNCNVTNTKNGGSAVADVDRRSENITVTTAINLNGGTYTAAGTVLRAWTNGAKLNFDNITIYNNKDTDSVWAFGSTSGGTQGAYVVLIKNPVGISEAFTSGSHKLENAEASVVIGGVRYYVFTGANGGAMVTDSGASIKISGNANGLRFTSFLSKKTVDGIEGTDVEFGTYIIPTHLIAEAGLDTFDVEALRAAGYKVLKIKAETSLNNEIKNEAGETVGYSIRAAITNIKEAHLNWEYSAITYITYKDAEGNVHTIYGNYSEADNSRSITAVAVAAYADVKAPDAEGYDASVYVYAVGDGTYSPYTTAQREAIKAFADKYVAD